METFLKNLIREAGDLASEYFKAGVKHSYKTSPSDLLTEADIATERFIMEGIKNKFPSHKITSEESGNTTSSDSSVEWVIDPIDGTRNFAMGIPTWCTMIAILQNNQLSYSAVYNPMAEELFFAEEGKGAFLNDKQIWCNKKSKLDHSLGMVCCDATGVETSRYRRVMKQLIDTNAWIHNHGTMLTSCYLAAGGVDFVFNNYGFDHDYLPIVLICQESGAEVMNSRGKKWQRGDRDILIANSALTSDLIRYFVNVQSEKVA